MYPMSITQNEKVDNFINTLSPIVVNEYIRRKKRNEKVITPATVLAQAALESGWNLEASTLFGIKGEGIIANTQEYIDGAYINIEASFQAYPSLADAVVGYYDLMQWDNYDDATNAIDYVGELEGLTNDVGYPYATAPDYKDICISIIQDFDLEKYTTYAREVFNVTIQESNVQVEPIKDFTLVYEDEITKLYRRL